MRISTFLLTRLVVLLVLSKQIWSDKRWVLQIDNLAGEVRSRYEIACLVVKCERALVSQEFVLCHHATKREDAGEFELSNRITVFLT